MSDGVLLYRCIVKLNEELVSKSYLYLFRFGKCSMGTGIYKIGITNNVDKRAKEIERRYGARYGKVTIIHRYNVPCAIIAEMVLHRFFKSQRKDKNREIYVLCAEDLILFQRIAKAVWGTISNYSLDTRIGWRERYVEPR